jgi:hypothetical protein
VGIILDVIALFVVFGAFSELGEIRGMKGTSKAVTAMLISLVWLAAQLGALLLIFRYLARASTLG